MHLRSAIGVSFLLAAALAAPSANQSHVPFAEDVLITIPQGQLRGYRTTSSSNAYFAFKGVPYAEPPVGPLRFKNPRPHLGWSGIWDASKHRSECLQTSTLGSYAGSEDCLFLNVYSRSLSERRPVMLFIHGGGFTGGSGNSFFYGPEVLVAEDVVLVTINYRLGFTGFFSTGDKHAPGNYGLKDCVEALQWVQDNIHHFGGDRNRVTIFGQSAGSVMVNLLVLSRTASGLFHRAISQSGMALVPWGLQTHPRETALKIASRMGLRSTTTEGIVAELMRITDVEELVRQTETLLDLPLPRGQSPFELAPVVETEWVEPPFLTEHPLDILKSGRWNHVPYIIGATSHDALYGVRELLIEPELFSKFEQNPHFLVPTQWNVEPGTPEAAEIVSSVRNLYFQGQSVREKIDYVDFCTDTHFLYAAFKSAEIMAAGQTPPVYFYIFGFSGILNYAKHVLLLDGYPGAMHADDIGYLFRIGDVPSPVLPGSSSYVTRARMAQMWSNFAKEGNPTPTATAEVPLIWKPFGTSRDYLWIGKDLEAGTYPNQERMSVWKELDRKHGPK